jgi:hypothetical protein
MKGLIERFLQVLDYSSDVGKSWRNEVDGGNVGEGWTGRMQLPISDS